jgi:NADPH-dependent 2,4-dienoyl-CoA reductase/sulfur reductase-like enzyme
MVSRELAFKPLLAKKTAPRRVVVIGGGAAGMATAATAARRGHKVTLFEKDKVLGGQMVLAYQPPHRDEIENALRYYEAEVKRHGVDVRLGARPSVEDVRALKPEAIIVATGAEAKRPDVPGAELPHVLTGWRVLAGEQQAGRNCVVIGGGLVGMEVADYLAERGKTVVLIARSELLKKAVHADRVYFLDRIKERNIEVLTHTKIIAIGKNSVDIATEGRLPRTLTHVDSVLFCTGYEPRAKESDPLKALGVPLLFAGDVLGSRKFFEAIEEGTLAALNLS